MGGLALKQCFTRRYQKDEFDLITPIIKEKFLKIFSKCDMPKYFALKESFGDADFVCCINDNFNVDINEYLLKEFNTKEIFKNGHVYSFEYKELQVDMILTHESKYNSSLNYFAFNDLGNLIGKIAHKFNLKHGYDGLKYVYRIDGKVLGEIVVSTDHIKTLDFLGFDSKRYEEGFDNLEEIFDFVTSSKYFNPWMFDFDTLNRINRERDSKRATYNAFVNHVAPMKDLGKEAYHYFYSDKKVYLGLIDHYFPGFLKKYRELEKKEERLRAISALYNGRIIMEHFDLAGKELGNAMTKFELDMGGKKSLDDFILETNDIKLIMNLFADYNQLKFKNCICEIGSPYNNLCCPIHGVDELKK